MPDLIRIHDLRVKTHIGVSKEERAAPREIVVNADIRTDTRQAGASDEIADTVDYDRAVVAISELVRSADARLLEHIAERIAQQLAGLEGVSGVTVEVIKEAPPTEEDVRAVSVRIERP